MLKLIASTVLASSFALTATPHASACEGGLGCKKKSCAPAPAAACEAAPAVQPAAPAATPDTPPAPPATAQNGRTQYRSYSYEPAPAYPAYRAPAARSYKSPNNWQQYQFRADHKLRGL